MRFRLRTLLIAVAVGPPLLAALLLWGWRQFVASRHNEAVIANPWWGLSEDEIFTLEITPEASQPPQPAP